VISCLILVEHIDIFCVLSVNDESDEGSADELPARRAAAQRRVNYHEISESDSSASEHRPKPRKNISSAQKQRRRRNDSDSEYQPSSDAEVKTVLAAHVVASRHKRLGSTSDEGGSETVSKKKGRLNRILSSSGSESEESDDVARRFVKSRNADADDNGSIGNGSHHDLPPVVNGKHDPVPAACNAASENNKGFTIANLLKDSSAVAPVNCGRPNVDRAPLIEDPDPFEDSLSGIEDLDLVSYVTQT